MKAGKLRHKVDIERKASADTWSTFASVWASIEPFKPSRSSSSILTDAINFPETESIVTIRYLSGVTAGMRIKFRSKYYNILYVTNKDERNIEMTMGVATVMDASAITSNIASDGQLLTLKRIVTSSYDPVAGSMTTPTTQTWQVYTILEQKNGDTSDALVINNSRTATIAAGVVRPLPGDQIGTFIIETVEPVMIDGVDRYYLCKVKS